MLPYQGPKWLFRGSPELEYFLENNDHVRASANVIQGRLLTALLLHAAFTDSDWKEKARPDKEKQGPDAKQQEAELLVIKPTAEELLRMEPTRRFGAGRRDSVWRLQVMRVLRAAAGTARASRVDGAVEAHSSSCMGRMES